jgi:signal peptidase
MSKLLTVRFVEGLAGALCLVAGVVFWAPALFGSQLLVVLSGSMEPTLPVGGLALMQRVDPATIKTGDIISFRLPKDPSIVVTHRAIEVVREPALAFRTKGDAVEEPDSFLVPHENVLGRVRLSFPRLGFLLQRVTHLLRTPLGFGLVVGVPTVVLMWGEARSLVFLMGSGSRRARRRKRLVERLQKRYPRAARRLA